MKIQENHVVGIHYTLRNDEGKVLDSSNGREPLDYIQGHGMIVPGLEKAMISRDLGEKFTVRVTPEEGYGVRSEEMIQEVPLSAFGGVGTVEKGMSFVARGPGGQFMVTVTEVKAETAVVDGNHELAGVALNFDIEVTSVREATAQELSHGLHAHGGCCGGHGHSHEEEDSCCGGHGHANEDDECCGGHGHGEEGGCCGRHQH